MKINISNNITVTATKELEDYCKSQLVLNNPEYITKEKMGLWIGNTPKKLHLYEKRGNNIILPFGCIQDIWSMVKEHELNTDFSDVNIKVSGEVPLYDYQETAVEEAIKNKNGVLVSPAGSGKTQMGIGIIRELGKKTLWCTHTGDLLKQSKDRLKQYLNCSIGTVTAGKVDIQDVTFATVQTMHKMDLESIKDEFSLVIIDECHRLISTPSRLTMFGKVVSNLKARYKIGLTATPHRADGMIKSLYAYLGNIFYEIDKKVVAEKTMKAKIVVKDTDFELNEYGPAFETDGTINFVKMIGELCEDKKRNSYIAECIKREKGKSCLVLSNRLSQLKAIKEEIGYGVMIDGKMTSKKGKAEREQAIQDMRDGKETVLFASYNLAKEGLDIPRLERLFLASPVRDEAVVIQSVGRIERKCFKNEPVVFDFVDSIGICFNMFKQRKRIYKKNNNELVTAKEV